MRDFLRVLSYVRRYIRHLVGAIIFTILFALMSGMSLGMILPFANVLFHDEPPTPATAQSGAVIDAAPMTGSPSVPQPPVVERVTQFRDATKARILEYFLRGGRTEALTRVCIFLGLVFLLKGVTNYFQAILMTTLEQRVIKDLRDDLYAHVHSLSLSFFHSTRTGLLISRLTHDVNLVRDALSAVFTNLMRNALLVLVFAAIVVWASWHLALLSFAILPALVLLTGEVSKRLRRLAREFQNKMADMSSVLQETISGIRVVKAFGMEDFENRRFREETKGYFKSYLRFKKVSYIASPLTEFLIVCGALAVFWYGGRQVMQGALLTPDWFLIFLAGMISMIQPIKEMGNGNTSLQQGIAAARRIVELFDTEAAVRDLPGAAPVAGFSDALRFENVSFRYGDEMTLTGIDLTIRKGEVVAIVGPSGAGKSTLADLIPRFYDPVEGRITLDGVDVRNVTVASLRSLLGIVTQETFLWNGTLRSNIAYGQEGVPADRVERAARDANAHTFISALPQGYDTEIGERGVRLSGGERQRIAIARAILKNPPILILDEATSSLDAESEALVQEAIANLVVGRTVIVIAHRLSTVQKADRIVVLDKGRIVQEGRHEELLRGDGIYKRFFERQFAGAFSAETPPAVRAADAARDEPGT
ncbi:MAG: ABC transporter ATP-binding protein [bacterium]